jgi:hypothetical protein
MIKSPLINAKRKICCCFTVDDSDESDTSTIHLQRVESDVSPSVLEPGIYSTKKFAADKIYYLNSGSHTILACFRHVVLNIDDESGTASDRPDHIPEDFWKDRYKYYSKYDRGVMIHQDSFTCEVQEKIAKHLSKLINERKKLETCLIYPCGVSNIPLQLSKYLTVKVLETNETKIKYLRQNAEIYEVTAQLELSPSPLEEITEKFDIFIICPEIDRKSQVKVWTDLGYLPDLLERASTLSSNIAILFPPTLDPYEFVECLKSLNMEPCVEFILLFDHSHLKNIACFLGNITKFPTSDIVNSILSKVGMDKRQRDFIFDILQKVGLKRVLEILDQAEAESEKGSVLEKLKSKSRKFIDILKDEERISLEGIIVLYRGSDGDEIARLFEQANVFFVEVESEGVSYVEVNRNVIEGFEDISRYVEDLKTKETPNKNSLFQLIGC